MHIMEFHVEQIFFENGSKVYMYVALKSKKCLSRCSPWKNPARSPICILYTESKY